MSTALRRHLRYNYGCTGREIAIRAARWQHNFKLVVTQIPPRAAAALLRGELHGWTTEHRCGRSKACTLCHQYTDSVLHMINCNAVRTIWRRAFPTTPFDSLDLLGFIDRAFTLQQRVLACTLLYGVYEFHRFWSHQSHTHPYTPLQLPSAIIHFIIAGTAEYRSPTMRTALATFRALLVGY